MMFFKLIRINNWIKNLLVFAPVVFSFNLFHKTFLFNELLAFLGFCFTTSAVYIINDIFDRKKDAKHPTKRNRPIASGRISVQTAIIVMILLLAFASSVVLFLNVNYLKVVLSYFVLSLLYTFFLKHINLLETLIVALFFVLRILAGCAAINVLPTEWIIVVTFFIALFLTVIKRRSELIILGDKAYEHRKVLQNYSAEFLDVIIYIAATITIFGYVLYTMDTRTVDTLRNGQLIYTSFFVVLGLFRFIQLSKSSDYNGEGDPTYLIIRDRFLQLTLFSWLVSIVVILYVL